MTLDQYLIYSAHRSLSDHGMPPTYERLLNSLIHLKHYPAAEAVLKRMTNKAHSLDDLAPEDA